MMAKKTKRIIAITPEEEVVIAVKPDVEPVFTPDPEPVFTKTNEEPEKPLENTDAMLARKFAETAAGQYQGMAIDRRLSHGEKITSLYGLCFILAGAAAILGLFSRQMYLDLEQAKTDIVQLQLRTAPTVLSAKPDADGVAQLKDDVVQLRTEVDGLKIANTNNISNAMTMLAKIEKQIYRINRHFGWVE